MIGIADQKLGNLGVGFLSKWNGLTFYLFFLVDGRIITHSIHTPSAYFFVLRPVTLPQPGLG